MKPRSKSCFLLICTVSLGIALSFSGCRENSHPTLPPSLKESETASPSPSETEASVSPSVYSIQTSAADIPDTEENSESPVETAETVFNFSVSPDAVYAALAAPDSIIDLSTALYTYDKMEYDLALLSACYPQYIRTDSIGTTADGRSLYTVYFGNQNAARQIVICAATHAREYMTAQLVMKQLEYYCAHYSDGSYNSIPYADLFENTCFVVIPMVNPDGVTISQLGETGLRRQDLRDNLHSIYNSDITGGFTTDDYYTYLTRWKANAVGVDLNRNYSPGWENVTDRKVPSSGLFKGDAPGSEAETSALMQLINSLSNPVMAISYHSYGDLVYWQYGQPEPLWTQNHELASHIADLTGYYLAGYSNEAGFSNWCVNVKGIPSVTVETGSVPTPLPLDQFDLLWSRHHDMWAMLAGL